MKANNKTFVITGGGNGMGRQLVLQLLNKGARVAAIDLKPEYLEETKQLAGKNAERLSTHVLNITDQAAVEALPDEVIKIHGSVDGLFNNAGIIQPFVKVNDLNFDAIIRVMDVNFYGALYMIKAFLPHFLKRPEAHIVNISSMGGFLPVPGQSIYGASKAAVKLMSEGLYAELKNTGVRVTIVFPGAIHTNITSNSGLEMPKANKGSSSIKMMEADKAAAMMIDAMENNKFRICVGSDSRMMDLLYRFSPKYATNLIAKKMGQLLAN
jgi:short-subunit dehydrogenase